MDELKVREWMDKIAEAKKVINENVFADQDSRYDGPVICNNEHVQILAGGWLKKIALLLGLETVTEPFDDNTITCSFTYKGIKFLSLESLVRENAGTDRK